MSVSVATCDTAYHMRDKPRKKKKQVLKILLKGYPHRSCTKLACVYKH